MRLKIAICDRERLFYEDIQRRIWVNRPEYNVVFYQYEKELLMAEKNYDIVFLDTEISDRNGEVLPSISFAITSPAFLTKSTKKALYTLYNTLQFLKTMLY